MGGRPAFAVAGNDRPARRGAGDQSAEIIEGGAAMSQNIAPPKLFFHATKATITIAGEQNG